MPVEVEDNSPFAGSNYPGHVGHDHDGHGHD